MKKIKSRIKRYFDGTKQYSTQRLILEMALIPFPLKVVLGVLYGALGGESLASTTDVIAQDGIAVLIIAGVFVAPLLETFIGQWLPIWFISKFTKRVSYIVLISAVIFSLQHLHVGMTGFLTALPIAIFLSWCFLIGRNQSRKKAYWTTTAAHAVHNAFAIGLYLLLPQ